MLRRKHSAAEASSVCEIYKRAELQECCRFVQYALRMKPPRLQLHSLAGAKPSLKHDIKLGVKGSQSHSPSAQAFAPDVPRSSWPASAAPMQLNLAAMPATFPVAASVTDIGCWRVLPFALLAHDTSF